MTAPLDLDQIEARADTMLLGDDCFATAKSYDDIIALIAEVRRLRGEYALAVEALEKLAQSKPGQWVSMVMPVKP